MYEKLIERLREYPDREETAGGYVEVDWQDLLDAADAIESLTAQLAALQSENAEKDGEIERLQLQRPVQVDGDVMALALELAETKAALSRVEAERDAAIADIPHDCEHCKYAEVNGACKLLPDGDEFSPDYTDGFDRDGYCDHWEWRGAQGEG